MKPVVDDSSSAGGWVTVFALLALGVVGYIAYQHRDRFLPPSQKATPVVASQLSEKSEKIFFDGRDKIVSGDYAAASALFASIDNDKAPQPARNWITMQNGLAYLLAGKLPEARAEFKKVADRGLYSKDPRHEKLAKFFVEAARLAASEEPVKGDAEKNFEPDSVEAFGLLILGLKDWNLGAFEDAANLLRQFKTMETPGPEIWLRRYRPFADAFAEAYAAFTVATQAAEGASSHQSKERALKDIGEAKAKLKNQPVLVAKLSDIESQLKKQVDATNAEMKSQIDAAEGADQKILDDVKTRVLGFSAKFNFGDANQIVFTATVDGDRAKAELDALGKRTQWLSKFKLMLVADINANGYSKPLTKKDTSTVPTGVKSADDNELTLTNKTTIPWPDLAPETMIAMAKEYLEKEKAPEVTIDRKWMLGGYLYQLGRKADAFALLRDAAQAKPEYKEGLKLFPEDGAK